jgi:hypothetical protein
MIPLAINGTCRHCGDIPAAGPETVSWTVIYRDRSENAAFKKCSRDPRKSTIHLKNSNSGRSFEFRHGEVTKPCLAGKSAGGLALLVAGG